MKRPTARGQPLLDSAGQMLSLGDRATLIYIDRLYLYGLPTDRQDAYEAQLDQLVTVSDQDDCGGVEIEFRDAADHLQKYWIEPRWLRRLPI